MMIPVWAATTDTTPAGNGSIMITADQLTYDGVSGRAEVKGSVVITKDDKTMTGAIGWYNTNTQEGYLTGGVSMIGTNMSMAASEVHVLHNHQFDATGNVHLQKDDRQLYGDHVNYNTETGYGEIIGNGQLMVADNILTGEHITAFTNEISATAKGNVTVSSTSRNVNATADEAVYTQTPNQNDGVAYLKGNARAVQNGNVLEAPELKIQLSDNSAETLGGRSTLIITPK
nr:LptA/OstA family protein [Veillonella sp. CHU594]